MSEPATSSLKWSGQGQTFAGFLRLLHQRNDFSDVTLVCDGQTFPAHSLVLSSCSTFLSSLLTQNNSTILITMTSIYTLKSLLTFLYSGEISVGGEDDVDNLLSLARRLQITCLCKEEKDAAGQEGLYCDENHNVEVEYVLQQKVEELNNDYLSCAHCGKIWSSHIETKTRMPEHECVDCWKMSQSVEAPSSVLSKSNYTIKDPDDNIEAIDKANTEMNGLESYTDQINFLVSFKMMKIWAGVGERSWHCLVCGKSFMRKQHCRQHMEVHLEGLHWPCLNCSKVFCSRISLRNHMKKLCKGKSLVIPEEIVEVVLEDIGRDI